jgi:hypothetical protein
MSVVSIRTAILCSMSEYGGGFESRQSRKAIWIPDQLEGLVSEVAIKLGISVDKLYNLAGDTPKGTPVPQYSPL